MSMLEKGRFAAQDADGNETTIVALVKQISDGRGGFIPGRMPELQTVDGRVVMHVEGSPHTYEILGGIAPFRVTTDDPREQLILGGVSS